LSVSEKKIFRGTAEQTEIKNFLVEFRLFRGTENAQNSVPNHSEAEKNTY
jgi:hypothetical protein